MKDQGSTGDNNTSVPASFASRLLKRFYSSVSRKMDHLVAILRVHEHSSDNDRVLVPLEEYFSYISDVNDRQKAILEAKKDYYQAARNEIDREDQISFARLNITLLSQGFVGSILAWLAGQALFADWTGSLLLFSLSVFGFLLAYFSFHGVDSARRSLLFAKDQWVAFNRINGPIYPSLLPQLSKRSNRHSFDCVKSYLDDDSVTGVIAAAPAITKQLTRDDLLTEGFYRFSSARRPYRDEGWDFALSFPVLMIVFWAMLAIASFVAFVGQIAIMWFCWWGGSESTLGFLNLVYSVPAAVVVSPPAV
jgi:hypothetical protein